MKKLVLAAAIAATFASGAVQAEEIAPGHDLSFNVAVTTDYIFRGIEQANEGIALQGGADYTHSSGLYAGTWLSSLKDGDPADVEVDLYAGYSSELDNGISYDVGVIYYMYPDAKFEWGNTWEAYVGVGYGPFSAKVSRSIGDFFTSPDDATYYEAGADFDIGYGVGLGLHAGYQDYDESGVDSVTDYGITLSKSVAGVDLSLAVTDTDIDGDDAKVAFTVAKSF